MKKKQTCSKTRKFDGKRYTLRQSSDKKSNAKKKAAAIRKRGGSARVVKSFGKFRTYGRG